MQCIYIYVSTMQQFMRLVATGFVQVRKLWQRMLLVGGLNPSENISQLGWFFPIYGEIQMFQTTNQKNASPTSHVSYDVYAVYDGLKLQIYQRISSSWCVAVQSLALWDGVKVIVLLKRWFHPPVISPSTRYIFYPVEKLVRYIFQDSPGLWHERVLWPQLIFVGFLASWL